MPAAAGDRKERTSDDRDAYDLIMKNKELLLARDPKKSPVRFSHENPEIQTLYREYLRAPLSGRSHHLLHTDHEGWKMPNQK